MFYIELAQKDSTVADWLGYCDLLWPSAVQRDAVKLNDGCESPRVHEGVLGLTLCPVLPGIAPPPPAKNLVQISGWKTDLLLSTFCASPLEDTSICRYTMNIRWKYKYLYQPSCIFMLVPLISVPAKCFASLLK